MPISKIKGGVIDDDSVQSSSLAHNLELDGTHVKIPSGTTAQRPGSPAVGYLRYNTTIGVLEQYMSDGWQSITVPPIITSLDVNNFDETDDPQTLVITGDNFDSGAAAVLLDDNGNTVSPTTSTRNSQSQITIVFSGSDTLTSDAGPYDVKVTCANGLEVTSANALTLDNTPTWTTASGNVGTVYEDEVMSTITLVATDPEGESITYAITSGALPTGLSLNTANGQITGTPNVSDTYNSVGVTHNFSVTADDGTGNVTAPQSFNIVRKWMDGSTQAQAATSVQHIRDIGVTTDGTFWIQPSGATSAYEVHGYNSIEGGGWELAYRVGTTTANTSGGDASGSWGVANWSGWGVTKTQSAVDTLSGNNDYSVKADNDAMSPSFVLTPFTDIMIISNRANKTDKRAGYRFGSTQANIRDKTGGTSSETRTTTVLFGSLQWLQVLDIKSDIATVNTYGGADYFGFKIRSDSGSTTASSNFTGGFHTTAMHYGSQIGTGRDNSDNGEWGGGFGGNYSNSGFFKLHGHWWNHGYQWTSGSAYNGNVFYGHSVYIRSNAT